MEELKLGWSYFKLGVLAFWEVLMIIGILGGGTIFGLILGGIPLIHMACNRGGKAVQIIKANKEKEKARQFWHDIPNTDLYARLSNNSLARECRKVYTQEDLLEGIVVMKERVQIGKERRWGRKVLLYADYGLKELEENEQKIFARWLIDYIPKENRGYNWTIGPATRLCGGSSSATIFNPTPNGGYVLDSGSPPTEERVGYKAKITFIEEKKPLIDW